MTLSLTRKSEIYYDGKFSVHAMPVGLHKWSSMLPNTAKIQVNHVTGKSYVAKLILGVTCCKWSNGFEIEFLIFYPVVKFWGSIWIPWLGTWTQKKGKRVHNALY